MSRLVAHDIAYSYPGRPRVLLGVDLRVDAGEAVAVIGSSGAGKSTLFRVLAGMSGPAQGSVEWDGTDPYATSRPRGAVGYVHQQHGLPLGVSVEMAVLGGEMHSWSPWKVIASPVLGPSASEHERVATVLARVGLEGRADDRVAELSVGQRQRVAVARTLLQKPGLVIADEPVASVDPATGDVILEQLVLEAKRGAAVLCSVHDVDKARRHFERVVALAGGGVLFDGHRDELTDDVITRVYRGEVA